jgi:cytoskeletal protein CcmA (bactofilin family)
MSFRKVGGVQYSATQNVIKSRYNVSDNLYVNKYVGEPNTVIEFLSDISGNITIYGDLDVSGNVHVSGDIDCSGNVDINGYVHVQQDIDCSGNLHVQQDIDCSGNLYVSGNIDCSGNVNVDGDVTAKAMFLPLDNDFSGYVTNSVVSKSYVDSVGSGVTPLPSCVLCSNAGAIDLSGNTQTIDGVSLSTYNGSYILVNAQGGNVANVDNGIYTISSGLWSRPSFLDTGDTAKGTATAILDGNIYKNYKFVCTTGTVVGDPLLWSIYDSANPTLAQVLIEGNIASTTIDMNNNNITNGATITATTFTGDLNGNATTATNIASGSGGSIPYQSSANHTSLLANGLAGDVLISNGGTAAPSWSSNFVTTNTPQTISAVKTFNSLPESSVAPTTGTQLTNKNYVDSAISGGSFVTTNTSQTISAVKTFNSLPESSVAPTTGTQLTNKNYVDSAISAIPAPINLLNSNNTWTGTNNFTNTGTGSLTSSATQPAASDSSTKVPTTAWVQTAISAIPAPTNLLNSNNTWTGTNNFTTALLSTTLDASINGVTVGRGKGDILQNVAVGYQALKSNISSGNNTAIGYLAGSTISTGLGGNTLVGYEAGSAISTGIGNICIGDEAGTAITDGNYNITIGNNNINNGNYQICIGDPLHIMFIQGGLQYTTSIINIHNNPLNFPLNQYYFVSTSSHSGDFDIPLPYIDTTRNGTTVTFRRYLDNSHDIIIKASTAGPNNNYVVSHDKVALSGTTMRLGTNVFGVTYTVRDNAWWTTVWLL